MELVIQIDDAEYNKICNYDGMNVTRMMRTIQNGTPLPKGHGRLIDADTYRKDMMNSRDFEFFKLLDMQTTIVEADQAADQEAANE